MFQQQIILFSLTSIQHEATWFSTNDCYRSKECLLFSTDLQDRIAFLSSKDYFSMMLSCCYGVAM